MDKEKFDIIVKIAERAERMNMLMYDKLSLVMDLENTTEKFNLRLNDFLNADDFDFAHDIIGIQNNFNRQTMEMENFFLPRFAGRE